MHVLEIIWVPSAPNVGNSNTKRRSQNWVGKIDHSAFDGICGCC